MRPFFINNFASASVCARLETRGSSNVTDFLSGSATVLPYVDFLMDLPLPRVHFRFRRFGSTRTRLVFFFAMTLAVGARSEVPPISTTGAQRLTCPFRSRHHSCYWRTIVDSYLAPKRAEFTELLPKQLGRDPRSLVFELPNPSYS